MEPKLPEARRLKHLTCTWLQKPCTWPHRDCMRWSLLQNVSPETQSQCESLLCASALPWDHFHVSRARHPDANEHTWAVKEAKNKGRDGLCVLYLSCLPSVSVQSRSPKKHGWRSLISSVAPCDEDERDLLGPPRMSWSGPRRLLRGQSVGKRARCIFLGMGASRAVRRGWAAYGLVITAWCIRMPGRGRECQAGLWALH